MGPVANAVRAKAEVGVEAAQAEVRKIMHRAPFDVAQNVGLEMEGPIARIGIDISQTLHGDRSPEIYLDRKAIKEGSWLQVALDAIRV